MVTPGKQTKTEYWTRVRDYLQCKDDRTVESSRGKKGSDANQMQIVNYSSTIKQNRASFRTQSTLNPNSETKCLTIF